MTQIALNTSKGQLVPLLFTQIDVADAQSAVAMNILETAATSGNLAVTEYKMPFAFEVVGISVLSNDARTGGTLTVDATINGTVTGLTAVLNATDTTHAFGTQPREKDRGVAGGRVGVKLTTAGTFTPVTADIAVVVWVLTFLEGI